MDMKNLVIKIVIVATLAVLVTVPTSLPTNAANCDGSNNTVQKLLECVTVEGVREHQAAFQAIADANGGTRVSGSPGYDASVDYVVNKLRATGYKITIQDFEFPFFQELAEPVLEQVSPNPVVYPPNDLAGFFTMQYSGSGDVTALVQPTVDVIIPPDPVPGTSNSGCEPEDFDGFVEGNIALVQRGTCTFAQKAINAEAAGAAGVIIFNEGQPGRTDAILGTLGAPDVSIPVVGASFAIGEELYNLDQAGDVTVHLFTSTISEIRATSNVFAESVTGNDDNVVMVGAHLDSVAEGPGINDNGSGSAAVLEVALQMKKVKPRNTLRFAWWGAEESGLLGSEFYVSNLRPEELAKIKLYLNFDMVGSPNFVRFVYDGDGSDTPDVGPPGSDVIEELFIDFFDSQSLATEPTAFDGRSDYGPFIAVGIPAGGLFTGAEGIKTEEQVAIYGGTAGLAYDPCYHQACDTFGNVSELVLGQNSDAVAFATLTFARSTSSLDDVGVKVAVKDREHKGHRVQR